MSEQTLISNIVAYFQKNIFENHISASLEKHSQLKSYNINPIVVRYLSEILEGNYSPMGVAKALFLPRVLGTSINTSFGTRIQSMFIDLNIASGSMIKGMDIEFTDQIDNRKKWCQLKAGPNTINSEDVNPLLKKFNDTINLARTNRAMRSINNTDFTVGIIYGEESELSQHYKRINDTFPVIIGKDFWHRLTGYPNFYENLVAALYCSIDNIDTKDLLNAGCEKLAKEIEESDLFNF